MRTMVIIAVFAFLGCEEERDGPTYLENWVFDTNDGAGDPDSGGQTDPDVTTAPDRPEPCGPGVANEWFECSCTLQLMADCERAFSCGNETMLTGWNVAGVDSADECANYISRICGNESATCWTDEATVSEVQACTSHVLSVSCDELEASHGTGACATLNEHTLARCL